MGIQLIKSVKKIKVVTIHVHQDQTKQMQLSIKLGINRPSATAWKDDTPEQTKKAIILGDSIIKHVRWYDLSHSLENSKMPVKNFSSARVTCMQDYVKSSLSENPHHLIIHVGTNDISTNDPSKFAKSISELALSVKSSKKQSETMEQKVVETTRHLKELS